MLSAREAKIRTLRLLKEKQKRGAENSLYEYIKQSWHVIEPNRQMVDGWHIQCIAEHLEAVSNLQIRNLIINIPPRHMKGCVNYTSVQTPSGWRQHGDIKIGDEVFHPSGQPVKVVAVSEKFDCNYEVELTNRETIKVNGDHLWTVYNRSMRKWQTRTTESLARLKIWSGGRAIFQIPKIECLRFDEKAQLLPAYFIGAWLGDGTSNNQCITHDVDDNEHIVKIEKLGIRATTTLSQGGRSIRTSFSRQGILESIRKLNLYKNKHIPDDYKYSSVTQRLELMAGLIDTDGHVSYDGRVRVCTSSAVLRDDIFDVATSLGWKPYICESESPGYEQYGDNKPHYQIGFNPKHKIPLALARKRKYLRTDHVERLVGIKEISISKNPEEGNCIQVDSPDGLYLVGKKCIPTHNSIQVCVDWPSWLWGPQKRPETDWLFGAYNPKLSTRDSVKCRRLIESEWYQERWGDVFQINHDQNEKMRYANDGGGTRVATSVGGSGVGENADFAVGDDPHKIKGVESKTQREGVFDWWDNEFSTRGNDPETFCQVLIMQRVHDMDLCGHLKEKGNYDELVLPFRHDPKIYVDFAKVSPLGNKDPRTKEGEILWPERFKTEATAKGVEAKYTSSLERSAQLGQRPTPKEGTTFKREGFNKRWHTLPETFDYIVDTWDLTQGGDTGVSKDVGYKLGLKAPYIYVLEEFRSKLTITQMLSEIPKLKALHLSTKETLIENAAAGKATASVLKDVIPGIKLITPIGSKEDRAEAQSYLFEAQNILFPDDNVKPWASDAVEEVIAFGPKAKFKDRVDSLIQGIEFLMGKKKKKRVAPGGSEAPSGWATDS